MEGLSGLDACFLYAENATQPMHVTLCAVLDPSGAPQGFGFEAVRDQIVARAALIPLLTRRVVEVPFGLHHPFWLDEGGFDPDHHIRRYELAAPGDDETLARFVAQVSTVPLDRRHPLWEIWFVEGLAGGKVAMIVKAHHAALDGIAGVEQLITLFDLERAPTRLRAATAETHPAEVAPSGLELLTWATVSRLRSAGDALPLLRRTASALLATRDARSQPAHTPAGTPLRAPRSVLNGTIDGRRTVAFGRLNLDDVKKVKEADPHTTVNDVVLAVCSGALRAYVRERGEAADRPLVAACPVNVRTEDHGHVGNRVSVMFVPLPIDVADPLERLQAVHRGARSAKAEHALLGDDTLQRWTELLDPTLTRVIIDRYAGSRAAERHPPTANVLVSNVPGPPFPLYLAGAELERAYPMGQVYDGVGLNLTVMSYRNRLDIGLMAATRLVPDVARLPDLLDAAWVELLKVTGVALST